MSRPDTTRLRGSIVPLVTPFHEGYLDEDALRRLVEYQIRHGSHGISVLGTTGEPTSLTPDERERVMALAVEAAGGRVPVLVGTGSNNHDETLRYTRLAERLGADALLLIVPYYNKPSQRGLYEHFRRAAAATRLPVVLYNIPGRSAVNLEPDTIAQLHADCENIVGVKEANPSLDQVSRVLARCGQDFLVYSGIETLCFPMLALGGAGHVSATANVAPERVARLYDLCAAGRWDEARDLHYELLELNEVLFLETNPGPVKAALGMMGLIDPEVRLPLAPVSEATAERVRAALDRLGLLQPVAATG
jgi:4-hydroxy-tetrahydrodipicolinate synthase